MEAKEKKVSKGRIVLLIIALALIIPLCGWYVLCSLLYDSNISISADSYEPLMLRVEDFEGLECREYSFPSDKGQMLAGYLYSSGEDQHGIVVLAHGFGGGGHNSYMDCADFFARNGYYVFAYDATAMDKSEGDRLGGAPQGVIDLEYAISFVEESDDIPDLPIVLFGHSWGAYSVSAVLTYHPEVMAVIECCGFNRSSDMFESVGRSQAGDVICAMTPFIRLHEFIRFGEYASNTAMDGFDSTDAAVMIVHSADDDVIGIEYGLDKYYEKYKDDARFTFVRFEDRGHNSIFIDPDNTYSKEFDAGFDLWVQTLGYVPDEDKERFAADKAAYINEHLDHYRWSHRLDEDLFESFVEFYDKNIR